MGKGEEGREKGKTASPIPEREGSTLLPLPFSTFIAGDRLVNELRQMRAAFDRGIKNEV